MSIIPDTALDKVSDTTNYFRVVIYFIYWAMEYLFFCSAIQYNISKAFFIYHTTFYLYL